MHYRNVTISRMCHIVTIIFCAFTFCREKFSPKKKRYNPLNLLLNFWTNPSRQKKKLLHVPSMLGILELA